MNNAPKWLSWQTNIDSRKSDFVCFTCQGVDLILFVCAAKEGAVDVMTLVPKNLKEKLGCYDSVCRRFTEGGRKKRGG